MLLRLIDNFSELTEESCIDVVLEYDGKMEKICLPFDDSAFSKNFRGMLGRYFIDYPKNPTTNHNAGENIIKSGQNLGYSLLDGNDKIYSFIGKIEAYGYHNLCVRIESSRSKFFDNYWETLVLPESKYILAAATKEYIRQYPNNDFQDNTELQFNLNVKSPMDEAISNLHEQNLPEVGKDDDMPLNILHIVFFGSSTDDTSHYAVSSGVQLLSTEGAINYDILPITDWHQLENHLNQTNSQSYHIAQIESPVFLKEEKYYFGSEEQKTHADKLFELLSEKKIAALCLDFRKNSSGEANVKEINGHAMLAELAKLANFSGFRNVIGLGEITEAWLSSQIFITFYKLISQGLTFNQAVVETRKKLQTTNQISQFKSNVIPFQYWSLITHYGGQELTFFNKPQADCHLDTSKVMSKIRQKMFGFNSQMLSAPSLISVSDSSLLSLIFNHRKSHRFISLLGKEGSGKTQLVHRFNFYLLQSKVINYSFYFDFNSFLYTQKDILEMIAPVLGINQNNITDVRNILKTTNCSFVLDDIFDQAKTEENKLYWSELFNFLKDLELDGHTIIATGINAISSVIDFSQVIVPSLSFDEQNMLASRILLEHQLVGKDNDANWSTLLDALQGNPFLIRKIIPKLKEFTSEELIKVINNHIMLQAENSIADSWYLWQWNFLNIEWKKFIFLCAKVDNLLLEIMTLSCNKNYSFSPAKNLMSTLGNEDMDVGDELTVFSNSGFTKRTSEGHVLDARPRRFILKYGQIEFGQELANPHIETLFSQVLCEGIKIISTHLMKNQNESHYYNLLTNRQYWVPHFERLWFAGDYKNFFSVTNAFGKLLHLASLGNELSNWSANLLDRTADISVSNSTHDSKVAWLELAKLAITSSNSIQNEKIENEATLWLNWFEKFDISASVDNEFDFILVHRAIEFLILFYQKFNKLDTCIYILNKAHNVYCHYEMWHQVINTLKLLIKFSVASEKFEDAFTAEETILNFIPYDNAPAGFQSEQMLEIIAGRISRGDLDAALILLDRIRQQKDIDRIVETVDWLQADILCQLHEDKNAVILYCGFWKKALSIGDKRRLEIIKEKFSLLSQRLGKNVFDEIIKLEIPGDTINLLDE